MNTVGKCFMCDKTNVVLGIIKGNGYCFRCMLHVCPIYLDERMSSITIKRPFSEEEIQTVNNVFEADRFVLRELFEGYYLLINER